MRVAGVDPIPIEMEGQGHAAKCVSPVERELSEMHVTYKHLSGLVDELANRLKSVLAKAPQNPPDARDTKASAEILGTSDLVDALASHRGDLVLLRDRLLALVRHIEL